MYEAFWEKLIAGKIKLRHLPLTAACGAERSWGAITKGEWKSREGDCWMWRDEGDAIFDSTGFSAYSSTPSSLVLSPEVSLCMCCFMNMIPFEV